MESIYLLIPVAMIFVALAIAAYLWAVNNEQYKDLDKEAHSILFDEDDNLTDDKSPNDNNNAPDDHTGS